VLGRGQAGISDAIKRIVAEWPYAVWGIHSDNGSEFMSQHLLQFTKACGLKFTRSRPYKKNDNAHVEQKNRFLVRDVVGYERYDSAEHVAWLNTVYAWLDVYANACLPLRKVVSKTREGSHVRKTYDVARTPLQRAFEADAIATQERTGWEAWAMGLNPLQLHRQLQTLLAQGPDGLNVASPPPQAPATRAVPQEGTQ
jgi:hypothetical protein